MTKTKSTKRALLASVMALFLCFSMLLGTTFAWFTDSVTSGNNIIKSGTLDVEMYWADGTEAPDSATWTDASTGAIFNYDKWEPGYVEVRHIKIANVGTLALKYQIKIVANGEVSDLADVIDVYYVDPAVQVNDRAQLTDANKLGTLTEVLANLANTANGELAANTADTITLALKMQESAGNEYQNLAIGSDFSVVLMATQDTVESDSFGTDYDADNSVDTVDAANVMLAANKDVTLMGCNEADGILNVPSGYTGTLTLVNSSIKSVQAAGDVNIVILGRVVVDANGSGVATASESGSSFDGSAITANGELNISGTGNLTAIAADVKAAFGIGGMNVSKLNISNVHIVKATGAVVDSKIGTDYGKQDFEGAPAIGSGYVGAEITLNNVTVDEALGGSKSAGIGARYHTGVTINIVDSVIKNVVGGSSSAGIGGSRMTKHMSGDLQNVTINITNSTVNATGGDFGAGIGSGYNTYCSGVTPAPVIAVTIDADSIITAQGGWLGAGIGTGHNALGFVGNIACDTSNVKAGSSEDPSWCCWGNPCTTAENIGLGVLSVKNFPDKFGKFVTNADELDAAVADGATSIYLADGEYDVYGCGGKTLTINGSKNAIIKLYNDGEDGCDYAFGSAGTGVGTYTFNGVTFDTTGNTGNYKGFAYMKGIFNDCNFVGAYSLNNANDFVFNRCTFDFKNGYFWTWGAKSVTFDGCTFNGNSKTILAHGSASTVININNCTFAATEKGYTGAGDNTAVVEMDPTSTNTYTINFTGENTKTDSYAGWTRVKDGSTGHTITGLN